VIKDAIAFSDDVDASMNAGICDLLRSMTGIGPLLRGPKVQKCLEAAFGETTLGELGKQVSIVTFNKNLWWPRVLHNFDPAKTSLAAQLAASLPGLGGIEDAELRAVLPREDWDTRNWKLVDAALASSAFPVALPIFRRASQSTDDAEARALADRHEYLDGGFTANNPALAAASRAAQFLADPGQCPATTMPHLRILSLGATQTRPDGLLERLDALAARLGICQEGAFVNWGYWQWLLHNPLREALLVMLGANDEASAEALRLLGPRRYCRWAPPVNEIDVGLDIMLGTKRSSANALNELAAEMPPPAWLIRWLEACYFHAAPSTAETKPVS
jgi:hypothetical protein